MAAVPAALLMSYIQGSKLSSAGDVFQVWLSCAWTCCDLRVLTYQVRLLPPPWGLAGGVGWEG